MIIHCLVDGLQCWARTFPEHVVSTTQILQTDRGPELFAGEDSRWTLTLQLLLDPQDLVQLGQALRPSRSTSLDLSGTKSNHDIGDGNIFGFARAVTHHNAPVSRVGIFRSLDRFGQGANLIDL